MSDCAVVECLVDGCSRPAKTRGWCEAHYNRFRKTGNVGGAAIRPKGPQNQTCSVDGCERRAMTRGYCDAHWQRWHKYGDPKASVPIKEYQPRRDR